MNKRILFVSAMLGAMAMTATLTSCVKDEVSSAVAGDRAQHIQNQKILEANEVTTKIANLQSSLRYAKQFLAQANLDLEYNKSLLVSLEAGSEGVQAYWQNQVNAQKKKIEAEEKTLETLKKLQGVDGGTLAEEWAKSDAELSAAKEVVNTKTAAANSKKEQILATKSNVLKEIKALNYDASKTFLGYALSSFNADVDETGTPINLFKTDSNQLFDTSYWFDGNQKITSTDLSTFTGSYKVTRVTSQKVADAVYKKLTETDIKSLEDALGKATDEAGTTSLYGILAQAKKDLEAATTEGDKINKTAAVAAAQKDIDDQISKISLYKKELEDLKAYVAEIQKGVPQEVIDGYKADIIAYNKALIEKDEAGSSKDKIEAEQKALSAITSVYYTGTGNIVTKIEESESNILNYKKKLREYEMSLANLDSTEWYSTDSGSSSKLNEAIKNCKKSIESNNSDIAYYNAMIPVYEQQIAALSQVK